MFGGSVVGCSWRGDLLMGHNYFGGSTRRSGRGKRFCYGIGLAWRFGDEVRLAWRYSNEIRLAWRFGDEIRLALKFDDEISLMW
jgi:hypothetical protein